MTVIFPDVKALFLKFNNKYFEDKLAFWEVKWSAKMTSNAGLCYYIPQRGLKSIRYKLKLNCILFSN
jgi:hypothetical protein